MGEELNATDVTERGLLGDRAYALVDGETGKVASAKFPRKWLTLFDHRAAFVNVPRPGEQPPPVRITLPDGKVVSSEEGALIGSCRRTLAGMSRSPRRRRRRRAWRSTGRISMGWRTVKR